MRLILMVLLFVGCSIKQPIMSTPVAFVFKTQKIRISATGFLKKEHKSLLLQGYLAGHALFVLRVGKRVCMNGKCMSYAQFNRNFLSPSYPAMMIKNILAKKPLFEGENLIKRVDGFIQSFTNSSFDIIYKVSIKKVYFKDRKNHILIKIKEIDG